MLAQDLANLNRRIAIRGPRMGELGDDQDATKYKSIKNAQAGGWSRGPSLEEELWLSFDQGAYHKVERRGTGDSAPLPSLLDGGV